MSWIDKLQASRTALLNKAEMAIVFSEGGGGVSEHFLRALKDRRPFLPQDYLDFLGRVNGLQIDMSVLFGSGKNGFPSIEQAEKRWSGVVDLSMFLPIGEDPSGRCFAVNREGEVWRFDHDPPDAENARRFSVSFSEFLNDVLMGNRFVELFDGHWQNRRDNEWSKHLREQGWL